MAFCANAALTTSCQKAFLASSKIIKKSACALVLLYYCDCMTTKIELTEAELKACLHALMHAEEKPDCNAWGQAVTKLDAALYHCTADVDDDVRTYWLKTECLADCTVREVVTEYCGKILFARNGNYKLQLTSVAAAELNARWAWNLVDAAELSFDAFRNATMGAK